MDANSLRSLSVVMVLLLVCIGWFVCYGRTSTPPTFVVVDIAPVVHEEAVRLAKLKDSGTTIQQQLVGFREGLLRDLESFSRGSGYIVAHKGVLNGDLNDVTEEFMAFREQE